MRVKNNLYMSTNIHYGNKNDKLVKRVLNSNSRKLEFSLSEYKVIMEDVLGYKSELRGNGDRITFFKEKYDSVIIDVPRSGDKTIGLDAIKKLKNLLMNK